MKMSDYCGRVEQRCPHGASIAVRQNRHVHHQTRACWQETMCQAHVVCLVENKARQGSLASDIDRWVVALVSQAPLPCSIEGLFGCGLACTSQCWGSFCSWWSILHKIALSVWAVGTVQAEPPNQAAVAICEISGTHSAVLSNHASNEWCSSIMMTT